MKTYKAYCLDLDGTIYRGKEAVEGAEGFVSRLQAQGIEPFYVTNNASMTQEQIAEKLRAIGIRADARRIMTSAIAAADFISRRYPGKSVYAIGSRGLAEALKQKGIEQVRENADAVVMGIDPEINYDKLATACLEVRKGAVFVSTNRDLAFPSERGLLPGNGAFTTLVAVSTGVEPIYIGKPEGHMLEAIRLGWNFKKEEMVMIGDNYDTDIEAGIRYGIDTVHVNTGVTPAETVLEKAAVPTALFPTLEDWVL